MNFPSYGHSMIFKKEILYFLLIIYQSYVAQPVSLYKSLLRDEHRAAAFMKWGFIWDGLAMFIQAK